VVNVGMGKQNILNAARRYVKAAVIPFPDFFGALKHSAINQDP